MLGKILLCSIILSQSALGVVKKSIQKSPYLRFDGSIHHPKVNLQNTMLAYTDKQGRDLKIINLKTRKVVTVTPHLVEQSFFWAPNGYRLVYREAYKEQEKLVSEVKAYDVPIKKSIAIDKVDGMTGTLSFDPRDYRFYLYSLKGIRVKQLKYPGKRLARWQLSQKNKRGYWIGSNNSILWVSSNGMRIKKVNSKEAGISSFNISPDGASIVWADQQERVYISKRGKKPKFLARGLDPQWHPKSKLILYAHARIIGDKIVDHDLRVMDLNGYGRFLSKNSSTDERYPVWLSKSSSILYTHHQSTDIYEMSFKQ